MTQQKTVKQRYLHKKDILSYYYNTYVGLAILLVLVIAMKVEKLPLLFCIGLTVLVIARIIYGIKKISHLISCPFCGDGARKKNWFANVYYLATIPLEKEQFICPNCGENIEVLDHEE